MTLSCLMRARNFPTTFSSWEVHGFPLALEAAGGSEVMKDPFIELCATCCTLMSLGHTMASTVVAQLHLWLTLANLPERDRYTFLSALISPTGLFEEGLHAF